ncbi:bifunctional 2-polyprenyl-6-hydroxyphenol methylase/3-demethylubiquinol 3-O-methyltransferase UbiG [Streptomyces sp. PTY087I2]|uniref:class I SAM-dependent methyltransferase n=1 Tax=Streptomyces sp. PTY087I2 TaxID=1819298 RepID=UPI00080B7ADD|nr:class I SAM-dependent methyltransferase [Streptomyces sp. PTY087I2]OCC10560.1 Methyltransferase domain protein [Streptomyces sp. PTY087I2]
MGLHDFYEPTLYERKVGLAPRVGPVYTAALDRLPPDSLVLELGSGIGDVLLPFARLGHRICGLDNSPKMLGRFRERLEEEGLSERAELLDRILPDIPAGIGADVVLMPNEIVSHVLGDTDLLTLFSNARRAGAPHAEVLLDVPRFDVTYLGSLAGAAGPLTRTHGLFDYEDGHHLRVSEQTTYTQESGVLSCTFQYDELDGNGELLSTWFRQLSLYPRRIREITATLELAGFEVLDVDDTCFPAGFDSVLIRARAL